MTISKMKQFSRGGGEIPYIPFSCVETINGEIVPETIAEATAFKSDAYPDAGNVSEALEAVACNLGTSYITTEIPLYRGRYDLMRKGVTVTSSDYQLMHTAFVVKDRIDNLYPQTEGFKRTYKLILEYDDSSRVESSMLKIKDTDVVNPLEFEILSVWGYANGMAHTTKQFDFDYDKLGYGHWEIYYKVPAGVTAYVTAVYLLIYDTAIKKVPIPNIANGCAFYISHDDNGVNLGNYEEWVIAGMPAMPREV